MGKKLMGNPKEEGLNLLEDKVPDSYRSQFEIGKKILKNPKEGSVEVLED